MEDRVAHYISKSLANCRNKLHDKSKTSQMELEGYNWLTCSKQPRLIDYHIGITNKLDCRWWRQVINNVIVSLRRNFQSPKFGRKFQREVHKNFRR